jgi:hypothetical protein
LAEEGLSSVLLRELSLCQNNAIAGKLSFLDQERQSLVCHSRPHFDDFVIGEIVLAEGIVSQYGVELAAFNGYGQNETARTGPLST